MAPVCGIKLPKEVGQYASAPLVVDGQAGLATGPNPFIHGRSQGLRGLQDPDRLDAGDEVTHPGMDIGPMLGGRMDLDFLAGLIAGLAASLHCLAMCGGVATAIAVNAGAKRGPLGKAVVLIQAQLARVGVYIALGAAAGAIGWGFHGAPDAGAAHAVLRWLAALTLVIAAYAVAEIPLFGGAAGRFAAKLASPVYRRLHHLHRFGPAGLGAAWGLMPCAMVYIATFYAGVSGGPVQGALIMAGFGLGTIPALTALGAGAGALTGAASNAWLKGAAALALLALAGVSALGV